MTTQTSTPNLTLEKAQGSEKQEIIRPLVIDNSLDGGEPPQEANSLDADERSELLACEAIIKTGLTSFVTVGRALVTIRDKRLYRENFPTFEKYCADKLRIGRSYAYRLIDGANVVDDLSTLGDIQLPASETYVRPLVGLKTPAQRKKAWKKAVKLAGDKPVTAAFVQQAADELLGNKNGNKPKTTKVSPSPTAMRTRVVELLKKLRGKLDGEEPATIAARKLVDKIENAVKKHWKN